MVERAFVHIGLPKTGTSYLQTILWASRDQLRADGVVLPGEERRDHLWASRVVREDPKVPGLSQRKRTAWDRIVAELAASDGTGLISHEFFASATQEQALRMVEGSRRPRCTSSSPPGTRSTCSPPAGRRA